MPPAPAARNALGTARDSVPDGGARRGHGTRGCYGRDCHRCAAPASEEGEAHAESGADRSAADGDTITDGDEAVAWGADDGHFVCLKEGGHRDGRVE